ncbi:helix-turn-helix domain-containing protein [Streptomyces sp. NBRC 110035]|uniref:helix-turn-helix domain-containing protein n=1 Tax=Streptomyces sp. NBRC 110035 TaxID=1547867 RepID=UPI001F2A82C6|nr:helix-turn-helix domain-containing protein [Streptomyces sp. NBRC 110035]
MDAQQLAEYRYRAVREVLGGSPIGEVAARYGTSRQTLHSWRRRFEQEGMPGLLDRSRRPGNSPTRLSAEVEAETCELRRRHPRWGARRISHELSGRGLESTPSRATVHRVLSRNGLVRAQEQQHPASAPDGSVRCRCTCGGWTWPEKGNCWAHRLQQATQPRTAAMYHSQFNARHARSRA